MNRSIEPYGAAEAGLGPRARARALSRSRSRPFGIAVAALIVLALGLGAAALVLHANLRWLRQGEVAAGEALETARSVAPDMLSYNHETVEQDLVRGRSHTTGELTGHYTRLLQVLVPAVRQQRTVRQAEVVSAAVERAEPDRVEVLLFVDMTTTRTVAGARDPQQQVSRDRARFVMVKSGARWLVAELSTLLGSVPSN
ncbi:hypothetical protein [Spongiactinospora sp. TRM90649]|uniref:hypothetical protein n=1 Tax=Spongiactinospora sp. TRM90649 TaxID=3031114 RepID=UPI0023F99B91|nr:hypothetical protein [Spongiactinospora sp. TRM90649]MDF5751548.1 hypothetical protein [Spongiactinospora sp. TRM90649]